MSQIQVSQNEPPRLSLVIRIVTANAAPHYTRFLPFTGFAVLLCIHLICKKGGVLSVFSSVGQRLVFSSPVWWIASPEEENWQMLIRTTYMYTRLFYRSLTCKTTCAFDWLIKYVCLWAVENRPPKRGQLFFWGHTCERRIDSGLLTDPIRPHSVVFCQSMTKTAWFFANQWIPANQTTTKHKIVGRPSNILELKLLNANPSQQRQLCAWGHWKSIENPVGESSKPQLKYNFRRPPKMNNQKSEELSENVLTKTSANSPQAKTTDFTFWGTRETEANETKTVQINFSENSDNPKPRNGQDNKLETFGGPKRASKQTQQTSKRFVLRAHDYADVESPKTNTEFSGWGGLRPEETLPTRSQKE